jgi:RNA polymerase sigma-70 factor (ECF subfamily)
MVGRTEYAHGLTENNMYFYLLGKPALYNEKELLMSIANDDELAFHSLYHHYRNKVVTIAYKVLQSEPEVLDALQEIFLKIWIIRAKLPAIDNFNAYLNTITRNYLSNRLRKRLYEETALSAIVRDKISAGQEDDPILLRQLHDILYKAIRKLPLQQKRVFELSRLEGVKQNDIAAQLHISRETVKRHLSEAARNLRNMLGSDMTAVILLILIGYPQ